MFYLHKSYVLIQDVSISQIYFLSVMLIGREILIMINKGKMVIYLYVTLVLSSKIRGGTRKLALGGPLCKKFILEGPLLKKCLEFL